MQIHINCMALSPLHQTTMTTNTPPNAASAAAAAAAAAAAIKNMLDEWEKDKERFFQEKMAREKKGNLKRWRKCEVKRKQDGDKTQ